MGNRMYRSHSSRHAAAIARLRRQQASIPSPSEESCIKLSQRVLISTSTPFLYHSYSKFSETQKVSEIHSSISVDSVELKDSQMTFKMLNKKPALVSVFFFAKELIDGKTKSMYFSLHPKSPKPLKFEYSDVGCRTVSVKLPLELSEFSEEDWEFKDKCTFPLILFVQSGKENWLGYFRAVQKRALKVRESLSNDDGSFEVLDVSEFSCENCVVCDDGLPGEVFVPCGHRCACGECLKMIMKGSRRCPMCRSYVFGWCNKYG